MGARIDVLVSEVCSFRLLSGSFKKQERPSSARNVPPSPDIVDYGVHLPYMALIGIPSLFVV